ncbi:MAG: hypothetical protein LQ338_001061 [Usnochroma carphineum]|nr:MAG: hypothetical protein LQ338_001061 [Usnochroma carphineum]
MSKGSKRVQKEYRELHENPPQDMKVNLVHDDDLYKWLITLVGPEDSPYAGGNFKLHVTLPTEYPFKPPQINWQTKIYHPNVTNDEQGSMCLGLLRPGEWKPNSTLSAALEYVRQLLVEPNPDDPVEQAIARQYTEERKEFNKQAKKWTKEYAK